MKKYPIAQYKVKKVFKCFADECLASSTRFKSWEDCYNAFAGVYKVGYKSANSKILALHLVGYLASWGMYRGSSKLLQEFDYLVHEKLTEQLFNNNNIKLFKLNPLTDCCEYRKVIVEAYNTIEKYYVSLGIKPSDTLITKILLGVYGCVPAYDINVHKSMKLYGINNNGKFSNRIDSLLKWLNANHNLIKDINNHKSIVIKSTTDYPFMKLLDMYFWTLSKKEN
ncbi:MAG: hypothetical protein E7542_01545 [Ruminococcaceae bacterium]|nr:hypothetical protein [Oscillospiraceae bacterium]